VTLALYHQFFREFFGLADERCRRYGGNTPEPHGHAAGLESLIRFAEVVGDPGARVLDAGAGASSAILRSIFHNVTSCDPDATYLPFVKATCDKMGYVDDRWVVGIPEGDFDAIFYDFGTNERIPLMPTFFDKTLKLFWADDCHDPRVLAEVRRLGEGKAVADEKSLDRYGRFGAWVRK
jgi:hypothetical protein